MVAASQGRLSSTADYDKFGLEELQEEVRRCLFNTHGVLEVSRLIVKKVDKGRGVHVNVHISVDSGTSVLQAHEIAKESREAIFDVDGCIDDATVHVDAQPKGDLHIDRMHGNSDSIDGVNEKVQNPSPARPQSSHSPEKHDCKRAVHSAGTNTRYISCFLRQDQA